ncbi:NAD(P)-binding protein [Hysterangium stoloniferum]|nr:NAD(P)-binding protein [Hysterangium stoloniferum]
MGGFFHISDRVLALNPPKAEKVTPVRFGILGAARIAPIALIGAARSHPNALVVAVAARDEKKARAFASKHDIGKVYFGPTGYQELLEDPEIDAIYNPLPNGLHFEWTAKALAVGKHVLLEKPSTNTVEEIQILFQIAKDNNVILLEAFHYRFHPAFRRFTEILRSGELGNIKSAKSELKVPGGLFSKNDIRYNFDLGGGALMDMGVYPISAVRSVLSSEPTEVLSATHRPHPGDRRVDSATDAALAFSNGTTAEIGCDLQMPWRFSIIPKWPVLHITVQLEGGEVSMFNFPGAYIYHSITVTSKEGKKRVETAYKPKNGKGEVWWTTYRYQLEAFVDKVQGRTPETWISEEDSVNQMKVVEMIYEKTTIRTQDYGTLEAELKAQARCLTE